MRIAFLTPEYVSEPKFDGGLANYIFRVTRLLREEGYDPEIFVTAEKDETIWHEGILVHRCAPSQSLKRLDRLQRRCLRRYWLSYMDVLIAAQALARVFSVRHRRQPFDIIEASNFKATGLLVTGSRRPAMVTRISYFGGEYWDRASGKRSDLDGRIRYKLEDICGWRSDLVYGPCTRMATLISQRAGYPVAVIHPPVFHSVDRIEEDDSVWRNTLRDIRYVLFFGRICKVKGVDILARAMRQILEDERDLRLVMVGRVESEEIIREVRALLGDRVEQLIHLNRLPHRQLFPVIRGAEFVILPSRVDNFPNVCVEAMLLGQIVIGTRETGFEDLIEDEWNGLLSSPEDYDNLASRIRWALGMTSEEKAMMRMNALHRIQELNPSEAVRKLIRYYEMAIETRRKIYLGHRVGQSGSAN